jgi:hypothetical protein
MLLRSRAAGHRALAERLGRPPGTVRGWLRAGRARAELLRRSGARWAYALDPCAGAHERISLPIALLTLSSTRWRRSNCASVSGVCQTTVRPLSIAIYYYVLPAKRQVFAAASAAVRRPEPDRKCVRGYRQL